jgi:serine/threonine-protein kinase
MLCQDGSLRLMDFGIALYPQCRRLTFIGFAPGTPHYMAPERVNGKRGDARTDLYSLGAMLYQMLTGVIAFDDPDISAIMNARVTGDPEAPRKLNPAISEAAEEIVLHAMSRDPAGRYSTAGEMKAELADPKTVPLTGRWRRLEPSTAWRRSLRHSRTIILWAVIPVVVQIVLFLILWRHFAKK